MFKIKGGGGGKKGGGGGGGGVSDTGMVISLKLYMLLNKLELCYIHCDTCILLNLKMDCPFSESRRTHCSVSNQSNS